MIPDFEADGLLKPGIHWAASIAELEARFGTNDHRLRLLAGFTRGCNRLEIAGCRDVYLDGSFTTAKEKPKDFDACWDTAGVDFALLDKVIREINRPAQKALFFGEFFPVTFGREPAHVFQETFKLFQRDKQTGKAKGIVGLHLRQHS